MGHVPGSCGIPQSRSILLTLDISFHGEGFQTPGGRLQWQEGEQHVCRGRDKTVLGPRAEQLGTALYHPCWLTLSLHLAAHL